jgi:hypothetical protein
MFELCYVVWELNISSALHAVVIHMFILLAARISYSVFAVPFVQMPGPGFQCLSLIQSNASHMISKASRL